MSHPYHNHPIPPHITSSDLEYLRNSQRNLGLSPSSSSAGSSSGLTIDPAALNALSNHFDQLLASINSRIDALSDQTRLAAMADQKRAHRAVDRATAEMEALREIMRQCDELETEFLKISRLGEMVKGFKARIEGLERRVAR